MWEVIFFSRLELFGCFSRDEPWLGTKPTASQRRPRLGQGKLPPCCSWQLVFHINYWPVLWGKVWYKWFQTLCRLKSNVSSIIKWHFNICRLRRKIFFWRHYMIRYNTSKFELLGTCVVALELATTLGRCIGKTRLCCVIVATEGGSKRKADTSARLDWRSHPASYIRVVLN